MENKSAKDLSENKDIRTTKLHSHRLSRSFRQLREMNAAIVVDGAGGHRDAYSFDKTDDLLNATSLFAWILNCEESLIQNYLNKKLGTDDITHAYRDKIYETERIIDSIAPYFKSDGPLDEKMDKFSKYRLFYGYKSLLTKSESFKKQFRNELDSRRKLTEDHLQDHYFNYYSYHHEVDNWSERLFQYGGKHFIHLSLEISKYFECIKEEDTALLEDFNHQFGQLVSVYMQYLDKSDGNVVQYSTFHNLFNKKQALISLNKNKHLIEAMLISNNRIDYAQLLSLRYEVMWFLKEYDAHFAELPIEFMLIPLICETECAAFEWVILDSAKSALDDMRFSICAMEKQGPPTLQIKAIDLEALSSLLLFYNIKGTFKDTFNTDNMESPELLKKQINKYPDSHAVVKPYTERDILRFLGNSYMKYFYSVIANQYGFAGNPEQVHCIW